VALRAASFRRTLVGCNCNSSNAAALSGAFAFNVNNAASNANWNIGASPTYPSNALMPRYFHTAW